MIVWKQTHRIISAGSRLIRKDSRMKLVRTNTGGIGLRIDNVSQDDRGKYSQSFYDNNFDTLFRKIIRNQIRSF